MEELLGRVDCRDVGAGHRIDRRVGDVLIPGIVRGNIWHPPIVVRAATTTSGRGGAGLRDADRAVGLVVGPAVGAAVGAAVATVEPGRCGRAASVSPPPDGVGTACAFGPLQAVT